jgi:metal-dependent amidase/aminoacylase/carboxypeptidase family protein
MTLPNPPPGWGTDELSKFWNAARANQFAVFVNKRPAYERLAAIDRAFLEVSKRWTNPQSEIAAMLFLRCHSAFRTAAGHAASGQVVESHVMNRAVLEAAAYALHIFRKPDLGMVWLNRLHTQTAVRVAEEIVGTGKVNANYKPNMASEDFSFMLQRKPGAYIFIGNGPEEGTNLLHNPGYDFNDDILPLGSSYWSRLVETVLT